MTEATRASVLLDTGPLLAALFQAQEQDAALAGQVRLRRAARALAAYADELGAPWIEPVSPAGHRIAGAAAVLYETVRLRPHTLSPLGQELLLVEGAAVGAAAVESYAHRMRAAGAARVWAFAADLPHDADGARGTDGCRVLGR